MSTRFITCLGLPEDTNTIPATQVLKKTLQKHHFVNTSTNSEGHLMPKFVRQEEVNIVRAPVKNQQPLWTVRVKCIKYDV